MNIGMYLHDAPADNFWDRLGFALEQGFSTFYMSPARVLPGFETADAPTRLDGHLAEQVRCALELTGLSCTAMGCACDPSAPDAEAVVVYTYRRMGNSMVVDMRTEKGAVAEVSTGDVACGKVRKSFTVPYLAYGPDAVKGVDPRRAPVVAFDVEGGKATLFRYAAFDWYRSNASRVDGAKGASGRTAQRFVYAPRSDGRRVPLSERLFINVSTNFAEVLPSIPNPPSPWKHVTGKRLWRAHARLRPDLKSRYQRRDNRNRRQRRRQGGSGEHKRELAVYDALESVDRRHRHHCERNGNGGGANARRIARHCRPCGGVRLHPLVCKGADP